MKRVPWVTIACVAAAAAVLLDPALFELDRARPAEAWRLLTGHLAHWSVYHFLVDAGTLLALGFLFERALGRGRWAAILAGGAVAVSAVFLLAEPHGTYRGLSGLCCAAFAAGLVVEGRRRPAVALVLGTLLAAKLLYECCSGQFLFPQAGLGDMGLPVMSAHAVGAACGLMGCVRATAAPPASPADPSRATALPRPSTSGSPP